MSFYSIAGTVTTVVSFVAFIAIVAWAWSAKRRKAFDEAANAPFALPDDDARIVRNAARKGRPS